MSIESLKQQARRHEQNEEWQKALDQYKKAINALAEDDQTDIGLINRVGDLNVRVGKLDGAVERYEQAVDLYREAYLPNNAIAVCKKIIRNVPGHHRAYLKIGQIRAEQGFLPDARTNFLTYAERMQQAGDLDESFRALVEFCDLAPDDVQVRITVADQMAANGRAQEAIDQLIIAYSRLTQTGETDLARGVEKKVHELDPDVDVGAAMVTVGSGATGAEDDFGLYGDLDLAAPAESEPHAAPEEEPAGAGDFRVSGSEESSEPSRALEEAAEEVVAELPMMGFGEDEDEDEEAAELPMMGFGEDEDEDDAAELPTMDFDAADEDEEAAELPTMEFGGEDDSGGEDAELDFAPEKTATEDAGVEDAAAALEEAMEEAAPDVTPEPAPQEPAPAEKPAEDFVDFGAMILGEGSQQKQKTTRFKVAYEEPTGDEEADFAKMLSQFKEKVSENLDSGDVRAHYDLGTAYKEMGLLEEAISSFQQALRASSDHLPTYEQMGQTFMEMGQPEAAVRTLERALRVESSVEDEFLGIYYYLARAFEALDRKDSAVEYYDRVFALDINFADVTERLRELR
jgi:tetratricopeptide (TPR) repeat protein